MFFRTFTLAAGLVGSLGTAQVKASCAGTVVPSVTCSSDIASSTDLTGSTTTASASASTSTLSTAALSVAVSISLGETSASTLSTTSTSLAISSSITTSATTSSTSVATSSSVATTSSSATTTTSASTSSSTVVVNPDGSGQFTAINSAILYAQQKAIPTVYVKAGTYNEALTVSGSAAVTVIGETTASNDYSQNKVTISVPGVAMTVNTDAVKNTVWKNINFVTTNTASPAYAVSLRGTKNAFYNCQIISAGSHAVYSTLGITLIANSYVEATTKTFAGYLGMYIFGSTITATAASNGVILYNQGYNSINSQVVFDSCTITQKSGASNKNVYLASPNGNYAQGVFKNTYMSNIVIPQGVYSYSASYVSDFYGEYNNAGPGSYAQNSASRSTLDNLVTSSQLSSWTIDSVFANSWPAYASTDLSWIDSSVLSSIRAVAAANAAATSSSTSVVSTTSSASTSSIASTTGSSSSSIASSSSSIASSSSTTGSSSLSTGSSSSTVSSVSSTGSSTSSTALLSSSSSTLSSATSPSSEGATTDSTTTQITTSSASIASSSTSSSVVATSTCVTYTLPSGVPSTAKVVGTVGSCANYTSVAAAVNDLPADSTTQYVYILAGTYDGQVSIARKGATIFRGESASPLDQSQNLVTITRSNGALSSSGSTESTSTFITTQYNAKKLAFYNINFVNTYAQANNYFAIAMDIKAQQVGFYSCGFKSTAGSFLANYGSFYLAGCRIEGGQDFFWGYGAAYVYNSIIVSNTAGYSIAAQNYQSSYGGSQFVFDSCAVVPSSSSLGAASTYLGRDYSASSRVAYLNSFLDGHIKPVGWSIGTTGTSVTFAESNNTGPGAAKSSGGSTSRPASVNLSPDVSAYSASSVLGDISWVDSAAVPAFSGFPSAIYPDTTSSTSAASSSTSATSTISSVSSTSATACSTATLVVNQTPESTCEYSTISAAVAALANDGLAKTIIVQPGSYNEQVIINRSGKVTLIGSTTFPNDFTENAVTVWYHYGVSTSAGQNELTPVLNSKKSDLAVHNINFKNTFEQTYNYAALAADFYGSNMAFYGCSFIGFQDTLLLNKGVQVLSNCYIEGSVDFIWGFSTAFLHGCYIAANTAGTSICAQSRSSATAAGGYVIDSSLITYTSSYGSTMGKTYLGRPYSSFSRVIYTNSYLDSNINAAGWSIWTTSNPQTSGVTFGEYNNVGPSSSTANRASFSTQLSADAAQAYTLGNWIGDTSWINMTAYNLAPSYSWDGSSATKVNGTATATASATVSSTASSTASATATATCGHPASGTEIPVGAVVVDASNATAGSYANLTAALAALPKDSTCQEIFILPGTYVEQASVNRPGQTVIIGYTTASPGRTYEGNQVTISYARGLDVSVSQPGHSDAETAVISTASNNIAFYNVNFINTMNLDGATSSFVTLAASIYGSHIGFYGCSFQGWQDTLLTGATAGYQYYESCYIDGAIDFIWGYSAAYFKGCTIAAKRKSSAITAHSRASSSAIGAYVFDECLVTAASGFSSALQNGVYLGRPYSKYAKVIYKNSNLDSVVNPSGWKIWSASDPRTDYITFAEFNNSGAGNWENNAVARTAYGHSSLLTSDTYPISSVMDSTSWIDMTYWDSITVPGGITTTPNTTTPTTTNTTVTEANSTTPGSGDYIVSKTPIDGKTTYSSFTEVIAAIASISSSKTVTVFVYPGVYDEQITFSRSGTTIFRGYTDSPHDNALNQVIVQNSHGVDTQADQSNSDSATLYSRAKYLQMYNINLNNVFGTTDDYASLGFAIGNNGYASFYGCQITGNQDTFDLNSGTSVFAYNSLIEGSIDFIWGAGSGYFLKSTIVPNADGGCITADKRASNTSAGGLVFDQCTVAAASGVSAGSIFLGRPYNQFARVAWVNSYLDSSINSAGWSVWSKSNPQTSGVIFGEYHNYGPGASTAGRASFSQQLSDADVAQFQLANFFSAQGTSWINMTYVDTQPFVVGTYTTNTYTYSTASSTTLVSTVFTTAATTFTVTIPGSTVTATATSLQRTTETLPAATVTTTKLTTEKVTGYTTISQDIVTKYTGVTTTVGSTVTVTPDPVIKTKLNSVTVVEGSTATVSPDAVTVSKFTTVSTTVGSSVTVTPDPVTVTKFNTVSSTTGSSVTVTSEPKTVYKYTTVTSTIISTSAVPGSTVTNVQTQTVATTLTSTEPDKTVTTTSKDTVTVTKTSTPKGTTVTSTVSTVTKPGSTITTSKKATTSVVTVISTVTKTSKTTTTLSCTPAAKVKRDLDMGSINRFNYRAVAAAAQATSTLFTTKTITTTAKPTTVTTTLLSPSTIDKTAKDATVTEFSTVTATAKTITSTINGGTTTLTTTDTSSVGGTVTLKPATTTTTIVSTQTSSITDVVTLKGVTTTDLETATQTKNIAGTTTLKGSTTTTTDTVTQVKTIGGTTTLKAGTTTVTSTVTSTSTSVVKTTAPAVTVQSTAVVTSKAVTTIPGTTNSVTVVKQATVSSTVTLPAETVEVDKTATITGARVTVTEAQQTVTKTTTSKSTATAWSTVTKYAKSATTCAV
ncbi:Pectinesterase [Cytospora mali]|uniref:pectinesterase n=1 Tax=Cytospora mali TaxID=578113 RepID=A0A194VG63_CYTMA|nr:Pectinesterase [Valsa mali var. pyri (nom. inval.)]